MIKKSSGCVNWRFNVRSVVRRSRFDGYLIPSRLLDICLSFDNHLCDNASSVRILLLEKKFIYEILEKKTYAGFFLIAQVANLSASWVAWTGIKFGSHFCLQTASLISSSFSPSSENGWKPANL